MTNEIRNQEILREYLQKEHNLTFISLHASGVVNKDLPTTEKLKKPITLTPASRLMAARRAVRNTA